MNCAPICSCWVSWELRSIGVFAMPDLRGGMYHSDELRLLLRDTLFESFKVAWPIYKTFYYLNVIKWFPPKHDLGSNIRNLIIGDNKEIVSD